MSGIFAAGSLAEYLKDAKPLGLDWDESTAYVVAAIVHVILLIHVFALAPFFFIWLERKASARIQDRLGPTRVGGKFGWLQSLADGIKLIQKEDLCPPAADGMLFRVAPYLVCISSFVAFVFLPFSEGWTAVAADVG
ncbi:MAG: NADH-quinone oxidoreductase subunit H, partial [Planctomycetaceae bacterium]